MKVLYITSSSYFDLEISLIRELSKLCDVTVMIVLYPDGIKASAFSIETMEEGVRIIRADNYSGMGKYKNLIDLSRWYIANNPSNSYLSSLRLAQKIKRFSREFDFVHVTDIRKTTFFLLPFIAKTKNKLLTIHDPIAHEELSLIRDFFERRLPYKCFRNLLFLSDTLLPQFKKRYGANYNIFRSRLSVYDYLGKYEVRENQYGKYILFFGRKCSYKGIELLINSFLQSKCIESGYKLVIAGAGPLRVNPSSLSIVVIDRYIENEELATLIGNCQFVVLPYLSATQSGCLMSAFQFSKPVLTTNVGDFKSYIINQHNGWIVEPDDLEALKEGLNLMEDTSSLIKSEDNFKCLDSWEMIAADLVNKYKEILNADAR